MCMEELVRRKNEIEERLEVLKGRESDQAFRVEELTEAINHKTQLYNAKIAEIEQTKAAWDGKMVKLDTLKKLVAQHKSSQIQKLLRGYVDGIKGLIGKINAVQFAYKISVFRRFDEIRQLSTSDFPRLDRKRLKIIEVRKAWLRGEILDKIQECMGDRECFADLIFHINFLVKYELYFSEPVFAEFLLSLISNEFEYHFMSNRESNRLDKPEWAFEFLLRRYEELERLFATYSECAIKLGGCTAEYASIITGSHALIDIKIREIAQCSSAQKRKLILHFAEAWLDFRESVQKAYNVLLPSDTVGWALFKMQRSHVKKELTRIHDLKYVLWFKEYRALCRDCIGYLARYSAIDPEFRLDLVVKMIVVHTKAFLDNLRFASREETRIACFVHSEVLELRAFISETESELNLAGHRDLSCDLGAKSLSILNIYAADVLKLITTLATGAAATSLRKIAYFTYTTAENRRNFIVEIHGILSDFRACARYDRIESLVARSIDTFLLDEVLMKVKLSSDEYLDFRRFYKETKHLFTYSEWQSDEVVEALSALFNGERHHGDAYDKLRRFYNGGESY